METIHADVLIIGGGLGGCAAALSACDEGLRVLLTEETDWLGGQVTSQGVPPDEHPWIDEDNQKGLDRIRRKVREIYLRMMDVKDEKESFNPGNGLVSSICHDPRVSVHVLNEMLMPYVLSGQLKIELNTSGITTVGRNGGLVERVTYQNKLTGNTGTAEALYFIDATEAGDVLPLAEVAYVTGAEAISEMNEPHALKTADPKDIQAFTYVLGMEYRTGEDHTIPEPELYFFWRDFHPDIWPTAYLSFFAPHPITKEKREYTLFREETGFPLWEYRRSFDSQNFNLPIDAGDVSLMNWPMGDDYF